jgi:hypothetical protein
VYAARRRRIVTPFFELFRCQTRVPPVNNNIIIMTRALCLGAKAISLETLVSMLCM